MTPLKTIIALAQQAPDCFPLSDKGEIEAGLFYDAVRPKIIPLLELAEKMAGVLEATDKIIQMDGKLEVNSFRHQDIQKALKAYDDFMKE